MIYVLSQFEIKAINGTWRQTKKKGGGRVCFCTSSPRFTLSGGKHGPGPEGPTAGDLSGEAEKLLNSYHGLKVGKRNCVSALFGNDRKVRDGKGLARFISTNSFGREEKTFQSRAIRERRPG
ncbi:hypothetical protein AVEN_109656-1 [Araneus ventricosus]|uniref:Uncharacterized protein n=1 Tax=Araneus ventricosus TaxID=182803 RepID=A0A4Y2FX22_ARAVE|nr:hypothetical protein AVEN_109656-1 [Araneus ventricosus]